MTAGFWGCAPKAVKEVRTGDKVYLQYSLEADGADIVPANEPQNMWLVVGQRTYPPVFEQALVGLKENGVKVISLKPEEAFGPAKPELMVKIPKSTLPADFDFREGMIVTGRTPDGKPEPARVKKVLDDFVVLDRNHPLAGKNLVYRVRVLKVEEK